MGSNIVKPKIPKNNVTREFLIDALNISFPNDISRLICEFTLFKHIIIKASPNHSTVILCDGTIISWGRDIHKQVSTTPKESGFLDVTSNGCYSMGLDKNGEIIFWGNNMYGDQYGYIYESPIEDPFPYGHPYGKIPEDSSYIAISAGLLCSAALTYDGKIIKWCPSRAVSKLDISGVTDITLTGYKLTALTSFGKIFIFDSSKQTVHTLKESDFIAISAGMRHLIALKKDGSLVGWGDDEYNQISDTPISSDFTAISAGCYHTIALRDNGTIVSWGDDNYSQISNCPTDSNFISISACEYHSMALKADGIIVSWGISEELIYRTSIARMRNVGVCKTVTEYLLRLVKMLIIVKIDVI